MDQLLTEVWLNGSEEAFDQIFHLIMSENVSGMLCSNILYIDSLVQFFNVVSYTKIMFIVVQWITNTQKPVPHH